jgi:hypothetical protein
MLIGIMVRMEMHLLLVWKYDIILLSVQLLIMMKAKSFGLSNAQGLFIKLKMILLMCGVLHMRLVMM